MKLTEITNIASLPDYAHNDNDQSVVEICVTRVTSCIRETGSVEQHCEALVNLLESCLHHNLQPSARDEDPPHAKISADIISCIFLVCIHPPYIIQYSCLNCKTKCVEYVCLTLYCL